MNIRILDKTCSTRGVARLLKSINVHDQLTLRFIKLCNFSNLTEKVKHLKEENERKTREIEDLSKTVSKKLHSFCSLYKPQIVRDVTDVTLAPHASAPSL